MQMNAFGKTSSIALTAEVKDEKTILRDVRFTAPYKIMRPFEKKDGSIEVMLMAASAGIMEGDCQEFQFCIGRGAEVELRSQSYEKIHQMEEGYARRNTKIEVQSGGSFFFHPQPVIPFKGSAFDNKTKVFLEDESALFFMSEILSSGRSAMGEKFAYRFYNNLTEIYRKGHLVYRDNTHYMPSNMPLEEMGMFEGYTHLLNMFITGLPQEDGFPEFAREIFSVHEGIEGGITRLKSGDYAVRALGYRAQSLEEISYTLFKQIRQNRMDQRDALR